MNHDIVYAKTSDILRYREHKRLLGHSSASIYIHISAIKGLYSYLKVSQKKLGINQIYAYNIASPIKNEKIKPCLTKPTLTLEEARLMILKTKQQRKYIWDYRDHAIVYLMLVCGLSQDEIFHLKREDLEELEGKTLLRLKSKGKTEQIEKIVLPPSLVQSITDYLSMRKDQNPYLFVSTKYRRSYKPLSPLFFRDMFPRVLKICRLENRGLTPHCLRHTAALLSFESGASLEDTRRLLRHQNVTSTLMYQRHTERLKDDSQLLIEQMIFDRDE